MNQADAGKPRRRMFWLVLTSAILLGVVLVVSGTGKVPGQVEFIDALLQSFWTPAVAYFVGYLLPWVEIVLGALLLLGILPRLVAAICLPITVSFMGNNIWAMLHGVEEFPVCGYCFGIWEAYFGALSPLGALIIDIVLFGLALVVVLLQRESFFAWRPWFVRR